MLKSRVRNKYTFIWQHLNSPAEWKAHIAWILLKIIRLEVVEWVAMIGGLRRLSMVKERRQWIKANATLTNEQVFEQTPDLR